MQAVNLHSTVFFYALGALLLLTQVGSFIVLSRRLDKIEEQMLDIPRRLDKLEEQIREIGRRLEGHGRRLDRVEQKSRAGSRNAA